MLELQEKEFEEQGTSNFWYDFFDGGYINPDRFLKPESAKKVKEAEKILLEYRELLMYSDKEIIYDL